MVGKQLSTKRDVTITDSHQHPGDVCTLRGGWKRQGTLTTIILLIKQTEGSESSSPSLSYWGRCSVLTSNTTALANNNSYFESPVNNAHRLLELVLEKWKTGSWIRQISQWSDLSLAPRTHKVQIEPTLTSCHLSSICGPWHTYIHRHQKKNKTNKPTLGLSFSLTRNSLDVNILPILSENFHSLTYTWIIYSLNFVFTCMSIYQHACMYTTQMWWYPWKPEEDIGSTGTELWIVVR